MMAYLMQQGNAPVRLFMHQDGQLLSHALLIDWLRQILPVAGIQGILSNHSFCIGPATMAFLSGVHHLVQSLGHWSSNVYQLYICTPSEALASLSQKLA